MKTIYELLMRENKRNKFKYNTGSSSPSFSLFLFFCIKHTLYMVGSGRFRFCSILLCVLLGVCMQYTLCVYLEYTHPYTCERFSFAESFYEFLFHHINSYTQQEVPNAHTHSTHTDINKTQKKNRIHCIEEKFTLLLLESSPNSKYFTYSQIVTQDGLVNLLNGLVKIKFS